LTDPPAPDVDALADLVLAARRLVIAEVQLGAVPQRPAFQLVLDGLSELRRRGFTLPRRLIFVRSEDDSTLARYTADGDQVVVNVSSEFWNDPVTAMRELARTGYLVSDDPRAIIYHEVGHTLHRQRFRRGWRWWLESSRPLTPDERRVAARVSRYATEDTGEFVAEVFAGLVVGREFDDDVGALYQKLRGPAI